MRSKSQRSTARFSGRGNAGWSYTMFWNSVARWISAQSCSGKLPKNSAGRVDAPCWTAPAS